MAGRVAARSDGLGRGAEFVVTLPCHDRGAPRGSRPERPARHVEQGAEQAAVLVVDDNVDAASALGLLLESAGFSVVLAHDGRSR